MAFFDVFRKKVVNVSNVYVFVCKGKSRNSSQISPNIAI